MNDFKNYLWHQSVDNIFSAISINSDKNESRYFPDINSANFRLTSSETEIDALKRLITECLNDKLELVLPNENLLLLFSVQWAGKNKLQSYCIQAFLCMENSIEELYYKENDFPFLYYYRLDCHPNTLGDLFKEPFCHLHTNNKGNPRVDFGSTNDRNPILKFIEFIYINHFYSTWSDWVEEICSLNGLYEKYCEIVNHYKLSNYEHLLLEEADTISTIKNEINKLKDKYPWKHFVDPSILTY